MEEYSLRIQFVRCNADTFLFRMNLQEVMNTLIRVTLFDENSATLSPPLLLKKLQNMIFMIFTTAVSFLFNDISIAVPTVRSFPSFPIYVVLYIPMLPQLLLCIYNAPLLLNVKMDKKIFIRKQSPPLVRNMYTPCLLLETFIATKVIFVNTAAS